MWNLKNNKSKYTKQKQGHRKQTCGYQRGEGRGGQVRNMELIDTNCCT